MHLLAKLTWGGILLVSYVAFFTFGFLIALLVVVLFVVKVLLVFI